MTEREIALMPEYISSIDLREVPTTSGVVDLATTAVDRFGNESPPMIIDDAELDF